jgi:hypothetical protein
MKTFICVICLFIGILAYNIYVPNIRDFHGCYGDEQCKGFFVGLFFGGCSLAALLKLNEHFEKSRKSRVCKSSSLDESVQSAPK